MDEREPIAHCERCGQPFYFVAMDDHIVAVDQPLQLTTTTTEKGDVIYRAELNVRYDWCSVVHNG